MTQPSPSSTSSSAESGAVERVHHLKTWPQPFADVRSGAKTFEYRYNDRDFRAGDILDLEEWRPATSDCPAGYTGESEARTVTYILHGGQFGIPAGYCVMALTAPGSAPQPPDEQVSQPFRADLKSDVGELVTALEEVADPIGFLRRHADERGHELNGHIANSLANDVNFVRQIARAALLRFRGASS